MMPYVDTSTQNSTTISLTCWFQMINLIFETQPSKQSNRNNKWISSELMVFGINTHEGDVVGLSKFRILHRRFEAIVSNFCNALKHIRQNV